MAILAVFGAVFTIYSTYYYEKRPEITIRTDALSRVFDLYKPVGNLKILYAGQDLRSSQKQLWTMTVTVINSGGTDIRKGDFDETVPFGLKFSHAEIVDTPSLQTSDPYLKESLKMRVNSDQIVFSPVMLDSQDSFEVSLLLLGPDAGTPVVNGIGKVAGLKQFKTDTIESKTTNKTRWEMVTGADALWVQIVRPVVYGIGGLLAIALFMLVIVLAILPFETIKEKQSKKERRDKISKFHPHGDLSRETRVLSEMFVLKGARALIDTWHAIDTIKFRKRLIQQLSAIKDEALFWSIVDRMASIKKTYWVYEELAKGGLISFEKDTPKLSDSLETSLKELADYLDVDLESKYSVFTHVYLGEKPSSFL